MDLRLKQTHDRDQIAIASMKSMLFRYQIPNSIHGQPKAAPQVTPPVAV